MGRPINKRNFGDTGDAGNQIRITGDIGGGVFTGYIVRQKATREFIVNLNGVEGRVRLVANDTPGVGEAFIDLFEPGSDADGSGADFTAAMGVATATLNNAGTGGDYNVSDVLTLVDDNGAVSPVNATFTVDTDSTTQIATFSVTTGGDYTTLPSPPTGITETNGGTGTGATFDLDTWDVIGSDSVAGGTLYDIAPIVTISGGGGTGATGTAVIAGGAVTGVTIDTAGSAFTSIPTISFVNAGRKFVERIKAHKVNATDGVQTQWDETLGVTPPAGQSRIDAA